MTPPGQLELPNHILGITPLERQSLDCLGMRGPVGSRGRQLPSWQAAVALPLTWTLLALAVIDNESIRTVPALKTIPIFLESNTRAQHSTQARYALPAGIHP